MTSVYETWWSDGPGEIKIELTKHFSIWHYTVSNAHGGSSGSTCNSGGTLRGAKATALRGMPIGKTYRLVVNGKDRGTFVRGQEKD